MGGTRHASGPSAGFTLLELIIVVGVVAALALVVVPAAGNVFGVRAKQEAARLAGTIRAMYGHAALSGSTCRIVFDLDEAAYWPECAEGRVRVVAKEESIRGKRVEEDERDFPRTEEEEQARQMIEAKTRFSQSEAFKKRELPDGVDFEAIWAQHQPEPYTAGTSFLYFFPGGQTERAYVYLAHGNDVFTIRVEPVTGRSRIFAERVPVPDRELSR